MALREFTDMTGKRIRLDYPPKRIVSLVPSQTELLFDLGLDAEVAGITRFCVHPEEWFRSKTRVGGTKQVHIDRVHTLKPDLIIANKEENVREQVAELAQHYPVWTSNIQNLEDALEMIRGIGLLAGREEKANSIAIDIADGFENLQKAASTKRVVYFIWRDPWMCAGGDTFINDIIETIGWVNVLKDKMRYPEVQLEELISLDPELILLSSEPYPFKDKHIAEIKNVLPGTEVKLVDGEMFSWYGSRLLQAIPYLDNLLRDIK